MHILEILSPSLCSSIVLGDIEKETELAKRIILSQINERENKRGLKIAVLYPSPDSILALLSLGSLYREILLN